MADVDHRDLAAVFEQGLDDGQAHGAGRAGDQRDFIL
jgi:hypothetical protein